MKYIGIFFSILFFSICASAQILTTEDYFKNGTLAWEQKNYSLAISNLKAVLEDSSSNSYQREFATVIIEECYKLLGTKDAAPTLVFDVSETNIQFAAEGDTKEISVMCNASWEPIGLPEWCKIVDLNSNYIKFWCDLNPSSIVRTGLITLKAGDIIREILISQDPGEEKNGRVFFRVSPNNAYLEASNGRVGYSSSPLVLSKGRYKVKISKDGYAPVDTTIRINDVVDTMRIVDVKLKSIFGKLNPIIIDEDGNRIKNVDFRIGRTVVDLDDVLNRYSYDDKERIEYLKVYMDGMIPMNQGVYDISISAPGYEIIKDKINIKEGEVVTYVKQLNSIMGSVVVNPGIDSHGAIVTIPELKIVANVGDTIEVPIGKYDMLVSKEGYILNEGIIALDIKKGECSRVTVNMSKKIDLYLSTQQGGESVFVDDIRVKYQSPYYVIPLIEGEEYRVSVRKKGYKTINKKIHATPNNSIIDLRNIVLESVDTVRFKANEQNLSIELHKKDDSQSVNYAEGLSIPIVKGQYVDFELPQGKYLVKLIRASESRPSRRIAYEGILNFTGEKEEYSFTTWTKLGFSSLNFVSLDFNPIRIADGDSEDGTVSLAKLGLLEFNICKGLSTSLLEVSLFDTSDVELPFGVDPYVGKTSYITPAYTCAFLNYEFRIGGRFFNKGDVNALMTYAYYPIIKTLYEEFSESWISGNELFMGIEASPRFMSLNMSLRVGVELLNANRNYYINYFDYSRPEELRWVDEVRTFPFSQTSFIIGLNMSYGARGARGKNILRVF